MPTTETKWEKYNGQYLSPGTQVKLFANVGTRGRASRQGLV